MILLFYYFFKYDTYYAQLYDKKGLPVGGITWGTNTTIPVQVGVGAA